MIHKKSLVIFLVTIALIILTYTFVNIGPIWDEKDPQLDIYEIDQYGYIYIIVLVISIIIIILGIFGIKSKRKNPELAGSWMNFVTIILGSLMALQALVMLIIIFFFIPSLDLPG